MGALVRYREWYGVSYKNGIAQPSKGLRLSGTEVGEGIIERQDESEKINYSVADPSMWRADSGISQAERVLKTGVVFRKADNQRELGWQEMYRRIKDGYLYVFDTCHEFIRTIPAIEADSKRPEDITQTNRGGEDHIADETRYACMSRPMIRQKPKKVDSRILTKPLTFGEVQKELSRKRGERIRI